MRGGNKNAKCWDEGKINKYLTVFSTPQYILLCFVYLGVKLLNVNK